MMLLQNSQDFFTQIAPTFGCVFLFQWIRIYASRVYDS
jgi:hypothetical protein